MPDINDVKEIAKNLLADNKWLWERTLRIAANAEIISQTDEVNRSNIPTERFSLLAAAYFCDTGFIRFTANDKAKDITLSEVNVTDLRKFSASIAAQELDETAAAGKIEKISNIITASSTKKTTITEAKILSDARGLEDMGAVGIYNEFRKNVIKGQDIGDALISWNKKIEYGYWESRLSGSFNYTTVAEIAKRRFKAAEIFMNQLATEKRNRDVKELLL